MYKAIIPVAGIGSRLEPLTNYIPKEMLPIGNMPAIDYIIKECIEADIREFIIVLSDKKQIIKEYLDEKYRKGISFQYVYQNEPLGLGDAIFQAKMYIDKSMFFVILPDEIMVSKENVLKGMIHLHNKTKGSIVAVKEIEEKECYRYAMINEIYDKIYDSNKIIKMVEKPKYGTMTSCMAVIGRYLLNRSIFDIIEFQNVGYNNEIQLTDAIDTLIKTDKIYSYLFNGKRYDIGSIELYLHAFFNISKKTDTYHELIDKYMLNK